MNLNNSNINIIINRPPEYIRFMNIDNNNNYRNYNTFLTNDDDDSEYLNTIWDSIVSNISIAECSRYINYDNYGGDDDDDDYENDDDDDYNNGMYIGDTGNYYNRFQNSESESDSNSSDEDLPNDEILYYDTSFEYSPLYVNNNNHGDYEYDFFTNLEDIKIGLSDVNKYSVCVELDRCGECVICKDDISNKTVVRKMECSHWYCCECSERWFKENKKCPVCNYLFE